jgi:purine-binding chemotaxis protein CheW
MSLAEADRRLEEAARLAETVDANDFEGLGRIRALLEEAVADGGCLDAHAVCAGSPDAGVAHALALLDRVILRETPFDEGIASLRNEIDCLLIPPVIEATPASSTSAAPADARATARRGDGAFMMDAAVSPAERPGTGKYLGFMLAGTEYGLDVRTVREIVGMQDITAVPRAPAALKGVINLRGQVIPVVEMRARFGLPVTTYGPETCIVVIEHASELIGLLVDRVAEVVNIADTNISPPPHFSRESEMTFVRGLGKVRGGVRILLDAEKGLVPSGLGRNREAAA